MPAYSFNRRFVDPIKVGLGMLPASPDAPFIRPKLQTIRAIGKRRHARPGETVQLYSGMRTRQCFKIGDARCTDVRPIRILVGNTPRELEAEVGFLSGVFHRPTSMEQFAMNDGFESASDMWEFWRKNHPGVITFDGLIIYWEPFANADR